MRPLLRLGRSEPLATESAFRSLLMGFVHRGLASPAMTGVVRPSLATTSFGRNGLGSSSPGVSVCSKVGVERVAVARVALLVTDRKPLLALH